eukprot:jgi/Bigna1/87392/estExt_fgenesh1_pg.C_190235
MVETTSDATRTLYCLLLHFLLHIVVEGGRAGTTTKAFAYTAGEGGARRGGDRRLAHRAIKGGRASPHPPTHLSSSFSRRSRSLLSLRNSHLELFSSLPEQIGNKAAMYTKSRAAPSNMKSRVAGQSAELLSDDTTTPTSSDGKKTAVVIGGGWAGFGAMKALSSAGWNVRVFDATPDPAALNGGLRNENGRPIEAGFKGFWWQYPNIYSLLDELNLKQSEVLTPFTRSGFYTPKGLFTQAPIFSDLPRDFSFFPRITIVGFLLQMIRYKSSEEMYLRYDKMTAMELFQESGVSTELIEGFLRPILLVGLFKPPEELSAALVMDMLYYYAIGHQYDFDVKWARSPISEAIIRPMVQDIQNNAQFAGLQIIVDDSRKASSVKIQRQGKDSSELIQADAVVLAVGVTGLKKIIQQSPSLANISPDLRRAAGSMKAIDVIATRIWFDKKVNCPFPSNVFSEYSELEGAGGTFFCLGYPA